jgi:hypothetical protein
LRRRSDLRCVAVWLASVHQAARRRLNCDTFQEI